MIAVLRHCFPIFYENSQKTSGNGKLNRSSSRSPESQPRVPTIQPPSAGSDPVVKSPADHLQSNRPFSDSSLESDVFESTQQQVIELDIGIIKREYWIIILG